MSARRPSLAEIGLAAQSLFQRTRLVVRRRRETLMLAGLFLTIAGFYYWTTFSASYTSIRAVHDVVYSRTSPEYYPLLTEGFLHGQLNLRTDTPVELLKLADPWDPAQSGKFRLPDATYFHGKFYLYFGPTPILLLFLPAKVLTGFYPSHSFAAFLFSAGGLLVNLLLFNHIRKACFPGCGLGWLVTGALILGFATTIPQMLRRPDVWEVAIACGYFTISCGVAAAYQFRRVGKLRYLLLSSLAFGLAVGSRPTLIFAAVAIVPPAAGFLWLHRNQLRLRRVLGVLSAAVVPYACCGAALLWYNYARFGDALEFGQKLQMHARDERKAPSLGLRYVGFNSRVYFLCPPQFSLRFPFVDAIDLPPVPAGQLGFENVFGLLPTMPALLLGWVALASLCVRAGRRTPGLKELILSLGAVFAATCPFVLLFAGACNRYQVDFAPPLAMLAALGLLMAGRGRFPHPALAIAVKALVGIVVAWTCALSTLISIEHESILKGGNADTWRVLSRFGNVGAYYLDRLSGITRGPLEVVLKFPDRASGSEVLYSGGAKGEFDTITVTYLAKGRITFAMDHNGFGGPTSAPISFDPATTHTVVFELGSLYPEYDLQYYRRDASRRAEFLRRRLFIAMDGKVVFDRSAAFDITKPSQVHWGWTPQPNLQAGFSGTVLRTAWQRDFNPAPTSFKAAPLQLDVKFPSNRVGYREPILATGEPGQADIIYVEYLGGDRLRFALDHWSLGVRRFPPITLDLARPHRITIAMGLFLGGGGPSKLRVEVDGKQVIDTTVPLYQVSGDAIYVGYAPYLNSSTVLEFSGKITASQPPDGSPRR